MIIWIKSNFLKQYFYLDVHVRRLNDRLSHFRVSVYFRVHVHVYVRIHVIKGHLLNSGQYDSEMSYKPTPNLNNHVTNSLIPWTSNQVNPSGVLAATFLTYLYQIFSV